MTTVTQILAAVHMHDKMSTLCEVGPVNTMHGQNLQLAFTNAAAVHTRQLHVTLTIG